MQTEMEKRSSLTIFPIQLVTERPNTFPSSNIFDDSYLARLRGGDEETAKHFDTYFRRMLRIKLWAKFGPAAQADLIDEIMAAALEKILNGEPRDPASLGAYVRGICANLVKRPDPASQFGAEVNFDQISDCALSAEETLILQERARTVRSVLTSLKSRDRLILVDLFFNELDRDDVCNKYGVTRDQLRLILFRARVRFQKKWMPN